jgi:hypothetical protein
MGLAYLAPQNSLSPGHRRALSHRAAPLWSLGHHLSCNRCSKAQSMVSGWSLWGLFSGCDGQSWLGQGAPPKRHPIGGPSPGDSRRS